VYVDDVLLAEAEAGSVHQARLRAAKVALGTSDTAMWVGVVPTCLMMMATGLSETDEPSIDSPLYRLLAERVPSLEAKSYLSNLKRFLPSGTLPHPIPKLFQARASRHTTRAPITHPEEELNAPPPSEQMLKDAVADYLKVHLALAYLLLPHRHCCKPALTTPCVPCVSGLQGVVWVMEYLGGSCNDYGYRYTSALNPSVAHIRQHATSVPLSFTFKSVQLINQLFCSSALRGAGSSCALSPPLRMLGL
jgi:hypothetical protein